MNNLLFIRQISLRTRIFVSMLLLTFVASILIAVVSIYQFRKEAKEYHQERLERKENAIVEHINYILQTTTYPLTTENIPLIFKERIYELADIHSMPLNFYDINGNLILSSKAIFKIDREKPQINPITLKVLQSSLDKRYVEFVNIDDVTFRSSYTYIKDNKFKPLAILNLPYEENTEYLDNEIKNFLIRFGQVYAFMFLTAVVLSYFLSSYITKSIKFISDKMEETKLHSRNEKIVVKDAGKEINLLINSYNNMVDKLEDSANKLAQSEREQAWREMAKQVAHEIKNPLTPMRLTVQSFQRKFNVNDPEADKKIADFSETLLQQIDTMNAVASAFSNFASMPAQQNEKLNFVNVVKLALEIFNEDYISFSSTHNEVMVTMDKTQLIRIVTNLVKNAIQALPETKQDKKISVDIEKHENNIKLSVSDNGIGIPDEIKENIFEPKFTTKSSGMGLGLPIIKKIIENYYGSIQFNSQKDKGSTFTVQFPI